MTPIPWRSRRIRARIYSHFREPAQPAVAFDMLSATLWNGAATSPGSRGDVRRIWLSNDREPEVDRIEAGKRPIIGAGFKRAAVDNSPADWISFPGLDEQARIADTIALYQAELAELDLEQNPSADDIRRRAELTELISGLQTFGHLKTVPGTQEFGSNEDAIYRALAAPNFAFRYRSRFTLTAGRPFTLWLRRFTPVPGQVNHHLQVNIGRKLRILFERDKATLYRVNTLRPPGQFATRDAERTALIEKRYGTRAQHEQIGAWRDEIEGVKQAYKGREATAQEKAQIESLKAQIKALQDTFALTDAEKTRLEELDEYLFTQKEPVELNETTDGLVGVPFSLTFFDLGFGMAEVVCDIGKNSWIYQDREILRTRQWAPLWGTGEAPSAPGYDSGERLEISGNGGALLWRFGYVKTHALDNLISAPIYLGRDDIDTTDDVIVSGDWTPGLPAGNDVVFLLHNMANDSPPRPGWYQMGVKFITTGAYYPVVTRASILLPALPRPASALIWDSDVQAAEHNGIVLNVKYDSARNITYEVSIHQKTGAELTIPQRLYELVCDVDAEMADGSFAPLVTGGIIAAQTDGNLAGITLHDAPVARESFGTVTFPVVSKLRVARQKRFPADFVFDGMRDNDIVRTALFSVGYTEEELVNIPAGQGNVAHSAAPGEKPCLKPDQDARVLDYLEREIVEEIGGGKEIFVDAAGFIRYEDPTDRLMAGPDFAHASAATMQQADAGRVYYAGDGDGASIERRWNTDGYFTQFRVEGGLNPETKKPFVAEHEIVEAADPDFADDPRHIGHHKPMESVKKDSHNSQGAVERALATMIRRHGYPRPEFSVLAPYDNDFLPGDRYVFEGGAFTLIGVPQADVERDEMALEIEEVIGND